MPVGSVASQARAFQLTLARALLSGFPSTEIQAVFAVLPRGGLAPLVLNSGLVQSGANPGTSFSFPLSGGGNAPASSQVWCDPVYLTATLNASWSRSGQTSSMTINADPFYGDLSINQTFSWQASSSATNQPWANLNTNCVIGVTDPVYGSYFQFRSPPLPSPPYPAGQSDVDLRTAASNVTISPAGDSATLTWGPSLSPLATLTITLSNPRSFAQYLADAMQLLTYVSLLDSYAAPTKTYSVSSTNTGGIGVTTQNVKLRFPSEFLSNGGVWNGGTLIWGGVTNCIGMYPSRGASAGGSPGNVALVGAGQIDPQLPWGSDVASLPPAPSYNLPYMRTDNGIGNPPVYHTHFVNMLCGYGMCPGLDPSLGGNAVAYTGTGYDGSFIVVLKSAMNLRQTMVSGQVASMSGAGGVFGGSTTTTTWPGASAALQPGKYIFDPWTIPGSPPYTIDPSGGVYTVVSLPLTGPGGIYWPFG